MTRMRTSDDPSSSDRNREDKEGGQNPGSLPSPPERVRTAQPDRDQRSLQDKLEQKARINRQQAEHIDNSPIDKSDDLEIWGFA